MSWKGQLSKNLQELRHNYKDLKSANPQFPILVREASGIEAKLVARYDKGVEKSVSVDGLSATEVGKKLQSLVKQA
ncbi:hypothetical protein QBZ16_001562 [Prototheca wickerhamii]|uniref:Ribosomal protein/NADH dehydrogenase domain-containing protein n=1 Tax=Prototheca wickerhamii TaxID=3111 RepID=A0AAD9IE76_PROWI|nr:hypothetical protein QBZ16_001562 [Prototheca wickerhamii]